ncbi:MAG: STN domain-containing protein [Planctomycetales bacterium]|nr:STN domain-containing protein [Planctomycetales bacterium]
MYSPFVRAQQPETWLTGRELSSHRQAVLPSLTWSNRTLEEALLSFAEAQRIAVYRDRRIDPNVSLQLTLHDVRVGEVYAQIATACMASAVDVGPVTYIGPQASAHELRTLIALRFAELARLPEARQVAFRAKRSVAWSDLATPKELVSGLASEADIDVVGLDVLPHDLWAAGSLPPLSWIERMTLLTIGFERTFEFSPNGQQVQIIPIRRPVAIVRHYPNTTAIRSIESRKDSLVPGVLFKVVRDRMYVKGKLEDHERVDALLRGDPLDRQRNRPPATTPKEVRIARFAVENKPLRPVLEQLARGLNVKVTFDETAIRAAGIALDQQVSVTIENATIEQTIAALLQDSGLTFERRADDFLIRPAR